MRVGWFIFAIWSEQCLQAELSPVVLAQAVNGVDEGILVWTRRRHRVWGLGLKPNELPTALEELGSAEGKQRRSCLNKASLLSPCSFCRGKLAHTSGCCCFYTVIMHLWRARIL